MTVNETLEQLQGRARQALNRNDTEEAVKLMAQVAEDSCKKCQDNEQDPSLASVWMLYGRALLENGRRMANVFGETIAQKQDEKEDALTDGTVVVESTSIKPADEGPAPVQVQNDIDQWEEVDEDDAEEEKENEEEMGGEDFEAAWEVLELSRLIYSQMHPATSENRMHLADAHLLLSEVSQEGGRFEDAADDIRKALAIKSEVLTADPQASDCAACVMAEVHYRLAATLEIDKTKVTEALEHAQTSQAYLKEFLKDVQAALASQPARTVSLKGKEKASATMPVATVIATMSPDELKQEAEKMTDLIAETEEKIQELQAAVDESTIGRQTSVDVSEKVPTESDALLQAMKDKFAAAATEKVPAVNDLSSLVKKKKPRLC